MDSQKKTYLTFFSISTAGSFENSMSRSRTKRKTLILQYMFGKSPHNLCLIANNGTYSLNANRYPMHDRFPFTGLPPPNVNISPHKPCTRLSFLRSPSASPSPSPSTSSPPHKVSLLGRVAFFHGEIPSYTGSMIPRRTRHVLAARTGADIPVWRSSGHALPSYELSASQLK